MAYTYKHGDRPLDGYTIQRAVGRGGFGEVYYALTDAGKQVALKYLRENADVELRGIQHVMNLKSPHLITIYDVKQGADGAPWVVMEYVSGPSLRDLIVADSKGMDEQKAAFFMSGIAKGLAYLHDRGIVHRDLKPGNIFYDDGYVKIGDYGLSKHIAVSKHSGQTVSVGTVHYMAPEIGSGSYTKAIDIYALGVILFEMLTGRLPFSGSSMGEILMRHLSEAPDVSGLPEPFAAVIAKSLSKEPRDRYQDANEMADALMSASGMSERVSRFDPATLSHVPRSEAGEADRTVTRTPGVPPIPPMDVRGATPPIPATRGIPGRVSDLARRFEKRTEEWQHRILGEPAGQMPRADAHPSHVEAADADLRRRRRTQLMTVAAIVIAISVAVGATMSDEEAGVATFLMLGGATVGSLLAYFKLVQRNLTPNTIADRIAFAGLGALFMLPALGPADHVGEPFQRMIIPIAASMALCDWKKRIEAGRRGLVQGGEAWAPGIVGLIVGGMAGVRWSWLAAGLCASSSILVQAAAAMWPIRRAGAMPGGASGPTPRKPAMTPEAFALREAAVVNQGGIPPLPPLPPMDLSRATSQFGGPGVLSGTAWTTPVSTAPAGRVLCGIVSTLLVACSLGCFFANLTVGRGPVRPELNEAWEAIPDVRVGTKSPERAAQREQESAFWLAMHRYESHADTSSGLLFGTLGAPAWLLFFGRKALQRYKLPIWRGTLRWIVASAGFCLSAGMISILAYQRLSGEERAATVFGLVAGAVIGVMALVVAGPKPAWMLEAGDAPRTSATADRERKEGFLFELTAGIGSCEEKGSLSVAGSGEVKEEVGATPREGIPSGAGAKSETASARTVIDAAAPSFVGRTANAGLSFLGKCLVLLGLLAVFGKHASIPTIRFDGSRTISIAEGTITLAEGGTTLYQNTLPRATVMVPLVVGCIFLMLSRRNDQAAHILRGALASGAAFVAAILLMGPMSQDLALFIKDEPWSTLNDDGVPLIITMAVVVASLVLLFWPKGKANTIVI